MINNNPYNIPERPQKTRKVIIETSPLYPHQINRTHDQHQQKSRNFIQKRSPTQPYYLESSVSDISRSPPTPHNYPRMDTSTVSQVSQWNGMQSTYQPISFQELNQKISILTSRLDNHDRKISALFEIRKQEYSKINNLSQSTSFSQQNFSMISKQLEKYHSMEQPMDKLRQQFSTYRSQNIKFNQDLKAQLQQQKDSITQDLILSFKQCLRQKFIEEETKISQYFTHFEQSETQRINLKINAISKSIKEQFQNSFAQKLKEKLSQLTVSLNQLQSNYQSFKDEVFDQVLATQDQKRWLYQMEDKLQKIQKNINNYNQIILPGTLGISQQYCFSQVLQLQYQQYLKVANKDPHMSIKSIERNYLIDKQGYLLDSNKFYLVDDQNHKIKLSQHQIIKLKQVGILK